MAAEYFNCDQLHKLQLHAITYRDYGAMEGELASIVFISG